MIIQNISELKVGFVGLGLIGQKRAKSIPININVAWGIDPSPKARENFKNQFNCDVYNILDLESLPKVDVIFISTTHEYLSKIACLALEKGIHTFVEKPGAISYKEILKIEKEYLRQNNICLYFGFNHRFHPSFIALKKYISENRLQNQITTIRAIYGHGGRRGYEKEWRMDPKKSGGGELLDQGSHLIDLCHFLTNKKFDVEYSDLRNVFWQSQVEDNVNIFLKSTDKNISANLAASWTEWKNKFLFEVFTKNFQFSINGLGGSYGLETLTIYKMSDELGPPETTSFQYLGSDSSWEKETLAFLLNIKNNHYTVNSLKDAINMHAIVHDIYTQNQCSWLEVH